MRSTTKRSALTDPRPGRLAAIHRPSVVAYIRMSTDKQEDSPERQRAQIAAYAKRRGYPIGDEYIDLGISGDRDRPGFQRLLADATLGKFDVILIDEPSRLSRTKASRFIAQVAYPLEEAGVTVEAASTGPVMWDDISGLIMTVVHADRSNAEVKNLSRRVLDGMAKTARAAWWNGEAPFGYVVREERDANDRRKVISRRLVPGDPQHVKAVQWLFKEYGAGRQSLVGISNELASRGIFSKKRRGDNTGKAITPQGIACILRNSAYVGDSTWNRRSSGKYSRLVEGKAQLQTKRGNNPESEWIVVPNSHPPLIDRKTFQAIKQRLKTHLKRRALPSELRGKAGCQGRTGGKTLPEPKIVVERTGDEVRVTINEQGVTMTRKGWRVWLEKAWADL